MTILPKTMYVQQVELSNAIVPSILEERAECFWNPPSNHPNISNEKNPVSLILLPTPTIQL